MALAEIFRLYAAIASSRFLSRLFSDHAVEFAFARSGLFLHQLAAFIRFLSAYFFEYSLSFARAFSGADALRSRCARRIFSRFFGYAAACVHLFEQNLLSRCFATKVSPQC